MLHLFLINDFKNYLNYTGLPTTDETSETIVLNLLCMYKMPFMDYETIDLIRIDTHIVYHAQRILKEWGWGLFKN